MPAYRTRDASARTLEVSTDAPPPPTVSIISPTPRAFTFPIHDTRFPNSPSSSPFEPTLKSIPSTPPPLRSFSPTSSIGSDSSISVLSSPTAPPSSQASSHRRRRSTASDIVERRPKKGDDDYIKRPENAFILFRRRKCEERQAAQDEDDGSSGPVKKQRQADLSKTISQQWKGLAPEERQYWEDLAKEKKKEHEAMYPNYVYRPQRTKDKKNKKGKTRGEHDTDTESFSFLLPMSSSPSRSLSRDFVSSHGHGHGRRAASAPTPPPAFQAIQLPTVWMPSCPTSPSLIPRISGRSPAPMANIPPPTESAPLTTFDYAPNDQLFMPSYQPHAAFDGSGLQQSSEAYHMFQVSADNASMGGPLLHALTIPPRDASLSGMSPADAIASSLVSPSDTYSSSMSSTSSHGAPFTPADALRMMNLVQHKDVPENVDADNDVSEMPAMPYGFWPGEAMWTDIENLMPDDFNLSSIPPVELGLGQFEAVPGSQQESVSTGCGEWMGPYGHAGGAQHGVDYPAEHEMMPPEEHDFDDAATPGGPDSFAGMFGHEHMNW
ncbi:hypothetical protein K466DRAFT_506638 [Polyporus arcularius HHB13444]|uniref:HMG box domain-containing protein n=1 Tax=Polyporus arcularius HHB13444 TaxID=1314778 RepID=A0A5C3NZE6_9APHY|nr:hypothetical protein K466DRAFT_506638 [Polyporus arcularius HHB13444]